MKYLQKISSIFFISLCLVVAIGSSAQAAVLYIGDITYNNVFSIVRNQSNDLSIDIDSYNKVTQRSAAIYNQAEWLYTVVPVVQGRLVDAVVISLGKNDLRLNPGSFPDDNSLDQAIRAILVGLGTAAPVFWILPHEHMAKSETQLAQLHKVSDAIMRATASVGASYTLYPVSLEDWALHYQLDFTSLLAKNQVTFSSDGAAVVADLLIAYANDQFINGSLILASEP